MAQMYAQEHRRVYHIGYSILTRYQNQPIYISVLKYIIHTVYLLHVPAKHVAIFREVHYKAYIHRNITEVITEVYAVYNML
jgi:hypothetical protein